MTFIQADAARLPFATDAFSLVLGSPPYCDARSYGIGAQRGCADWIDWMLAVTTEAVRVSNGLVIWICAGVTRKWCYQPGPEGLLYEWWKRGGRCWRPAYWHRVGIPGSGGKQWLRADVEYALCFTKCQAEIPWADNTANGHAPKWAPGGEMSHRLADGARVNQWGKPVNVDGRPSGSDGEIEPGVPAAVTLKPSHVTIVNRRDKCGRDQPTGNKDVDGNRKPQGRRVTRGSTAGDTIQDDAYAPPVLANPGVLIKGIKVGGGLMGHPLAHENEAPFPAKLAEWFVRGWCPPGGKVLDPFSGSGTTVAAATKLGRVGIGCDLRASQCDLGRRRCETIQTEMFDG